MKREHYLIGAIAAALGILATLGFSSPGAEIKELKASNSEVEKRLASHDIELAKIDQKLTDIADGMEELLGHNLRGRRR